ASSEATAFHLPPNPSLCWLQSPLSLLSRAVHTVICAYRAGHHSVRALQGTNRRLTDSPACSHYICANRAANYCSYLSTRTGRPSPPIRLVLHEQFIYTNSLPRVSRETRGNRFVGVIVAEYHTHQDKANRRRFSTKITIDDSSFLTGTCTGWFDYPWGVGLPVKVYPSSLAGGEPPFR
ncbi:Hypothetical predicted protein, partial [Pelobates cultripes]